MKNKIENMNKRIDQAFSDFKSQCGGLRNDYFGLIYLEDEFGIPREKIVNQIAFGGNDYGLDGFHFDREKKNLYLFQFKYSESYSQFKQSLQRLIEIGLKRIFLVPNEDSKKNQLILQLRSCMFENRSIIDKVFFHFIFIGDPAEAKRSQVLDKLREDLENKKYLIEEYFHGQNVSLVVEFRSFTGKVEPSNVNGDSTPFFTLPISQMLSLTDTGGELMYIGFIRLVDLDEMFRGMGNRFFERNIRYGLGNSETVNRAISKSLKQIILNGDEDPYVFTFNHNGITLYAEKFENIDGQHKITAPRLLNGAQTITTFREFLEKNNDNPYFLQKQDRLQKIHVLCKIITQANQEFITNVTINNNRQNPVEPWNLHANDMIQLELQDKFCDDLSIYYERQEKAFSSRSQDEWEELGIIEAQAVELVKLAQTFLVSDGNIQRLSNLRDMFEDEKLYNQVFSQNRLRADSRHIVLCYKIQFRLRKLIKQIVDKGPNRYEFLYRSRNLLWALLCQGVLNDENIDDLSEQYGKQMTIPADYTAYLSKIATSRCRFIISELIKDEDYVEKVKEDNFNFLRTNKAYEQCMDFAYKKWKWVKKRLN